MVQSKIPYVGFRTGTANILFAMVFLKAESLDFHIFLTLIKYSLQTLSLLTVPTYDIFKVSKQASKQANKQAGRQAGRQTSKQSSKQASNQASN